MTMNAHPLACASHSPLRHALIAMIALAAFLAGVLAQAFTAHIALPFTLLIALSAVFACLAACIAGSMRGATRMAFVSLHARRSAAARRRFDEARLNAIIRSSREAIITTDAAQRIVLMNPMAETLFGCDAAQALGTPLSRFIPERFRAAHAQHVNRFGSTGASDRRMGSQRVLYALRADGREFPIEASISHSENDGEKLYTVMLRDVTERVHAEEALRQSREDLRELSANLQHVREEEKAHIARELHDDLGQSLTALKMDLSLIQRAMTRDAFDRAEVNERIAVMARLIDDTVASVRRIAANQRPAMLDDLGLLAAIDWLADDFSQRYAIAVKRHVDVGAAVFSHDTSTALFRIVQEALTNVARHADATLVTLALRVADDACTLVIADDGRGAPHAPSEGGAHARQHFGLLGIRERAHMLGGIVSTGDPGKGFRISITFPVNALQPQETHP